MEEIKLQLKEAAQAILDNIDKGTKVSARRVRKATLIISKLRKEYKKLSMEAEKKA